MKNTIEKLASSNLVGIELGNDSFTEVRILKSNSIDELISIATQNSIKNFFWGVTNYDIRDFLISYRPERFTSKGIEKIELYNSHVTNLDFNKPYKTTIFFKLDSIPIGINIIDDWILEEELADPDTYLEVIKEEDEEEYYEEIAVERKVNKDTRSEAKEIISQFILNDPDFKYKKNQEIRYWYFHDIMDKEEMEEYRDILKPYGAPHIGNVKMFMDELWMKYKEEQKKLK